ncbi:MAG: STAS domain-containing protein [Atopobiaceae bacterium]|nr:STAS domain-containing protein [Atopobiaceae bacterium]
MSLVVTQSVSNNKCVVSVAGEVDVSNAAELRGALEEAIAADVTGIEVDLSQAPYVDSTGIGVLVGAARRAQEASKQLKITKPQRNVQRVLSLLGVSDELGVSA